MDFCLAKRRVVSWGGLSEAGRRACKQRMWRAQSRSTHLSQPSFFHTYSDPHHPSRPRASTPPSHQATGITEDLYHRAYAFCTRLLTLPAPYSTVALDCAIRLKTETAVPGGSYWHPGRPCSNAILLSIQLFSPGCQSAQHSQLLPGRVENWSEGPRGWLTDVVCLQVHCTSGLSLQSRT